MQVLIIANALDGGALAVARILASTLGENLTVLLPEWLGQAGWSHRISPHGLAHTVVRWNGGCLLDSDDVGLVWNRIRHLPQSAFRASAAPDRDYAGAELNALVLSWLAELGARVIPPVVRHACVTPVLHHLHWASAARRSGISLAADLNAPETFSMLRTPLGIWSPDMTVWPAPFAFACHAMAEELGLSLLSLGFGGTVAAPLLCRVDAHPALALAEEQRAVANWILHRFNSQTDSAIQATSGALA